MTLFPGSIHHGGERHPLQWAARLNVKREKQAARGRFQQELGIGKRKHRLLFNKSSSSFPGLLLGVPGSPDHRGSVTIGGV